MTCTTHHHACDCREAKFAGLEDERNQWKAECIKQATRVGELEGENAKLREALEDAEYIAEVMRRRAEDSESVSWEDVKEELNLSKPSEALKE